jgi:hypothetical protein
MMFRQMKRVRRRMRLQEAFDQGARVAILAAGGIVVAVYLWRLGVIGGRDLAQLGGAAAAIVLVGALGGALRKIRFDRVAKKIDVTHQLHDRISSAWCFQGEEVKTPFMQAAIDDAWEQSIDAKKAAPLRSPEGLGLASVTLAIAAGVALLYFPGGSGPGPASPRLPRLAVPDDALQPEKQAAEELQRAAEETDDPALKEATNELNKLLAQVQKEELTRKQAFDKLAEIEKKIRPGSDGDFEELKRMLKKAGAELSKEKLTREAGQALEKEDLKKAKEELEKLAAEAEKLDQEKKKDPKTEKEREDIARSLERTAKQQQQQSEEEKKRQQEEQRLKDEERRLKKELAQKPNDQELQRKLQRNQRELQRLEKEKQQRAEQQRQLQRLQKELQKAAEQLRQKLSPQAAEALRQAAQQLGQMENEIKKLGTGQRAQLQIAEIKEVLRRVGRSGNGQQGQDGQQGQQPGQQQQAQAGTDGKQGQGQNGKAGKGGKQGEMMREFNSRAGGSKPSALLLGGQGGDTRILLPLGGQGHQGQNPGQGGQGQQDPGDGIGSAHDPNVLGDKTKLDSRRKDTRVEGQEAAGPSRSETILGSAEKGFATRAYKRVYGDYSSVVEEVMSKEKVPPGYRFYVKRYFQLIKPRE